MHSSLGNPLAYYRLLKGVWNIYQKKDDCQWMFSVILESNKNEHTLTKTSTLFPGARKIGRIHHAGFPMFAGNRRSKVHILNIDVEQAWSVYQDNNQFVNFALAEEAVFKLQNGFFLAVEKNGEIQSICKIIDQSAVRTIISSRPLTFAQKIINFYCRINKRKTFPGKNEVFAHCYLSYYTSVSQTDYRMDFIAYARKHYAGQYVYIFTGLNSDENKDYLPGPFNISFHSGVYAYGEIPETEFRFPELTLI
jgi:hypothetical protein